MTKPREPAAASARSRGRDLTAHRHHLLLFWLTPLLMMGLMYSLTRPYGIVWIGILTALCFMIAILRLCAKSGWARDRTNLKQCLRLRAYLLGVLDRRRGENRGLHAKLFAAAAVLGGVLCANAVVLRIMPFTTIATDPNSVDMKVSFLPSDAADLATGIVVSIPSSEFDRVRSVKVALGKPSWSVPISETTIVSAGPETTSVELPAYVSTPKSSIDRFRKYINWPGDRTLFNLAITALVSAVAAGFARIFALGLLRWTIIRRKWWHAGVRVLLGVAGLDRAE
jgi:hypothetical protein